MSLSGNERALHLGQPGIILDLAGTSGCLPLTVAVSGLVGHIVVRVVGAVWVMLTVRAEAYPSRSRCVLLRAATTCILPERPMAARSVMMRMPFSKCRTHCTVWNSPDLKLQADSRQRRQRPHRVGHRASTW